MNKKRYTLFFVLSAIVILALTWMNIALGSVEIAPWKVIGALAGDAGDAIQTAIIRTIRLPRALSAILLGGALALSGYLLQTFFSNPIVGPFVLGLSSGAKLTVALAMIWFLSGGRELPLAAMVGAAFAGALLAMGVVLLLSVRLRSMGVLVVCGIMIGYICSAVTDFVVTFADDSNIVNLHNWSMGSLSGMNWGQLRVMAVIIGFCLLVSLSLVKPMSAYRLGEDYARSAGVHILRLRTVLILVSSLLAACVTAFAGPVSFVGIAVPHLARLCLKTDDAHVMIPASFLGGAAVTLLCDAAARCLFAPAEVSISSVTAVLLVPVVMWMMIQKNSRSRNP